MRRKELNANFMRDALKLEEKIVITLKGLNQ